MAKKKDVETPEGAAPVRVPPKMGTAGPESGPSGDVVVDANSPGPAALPLAHADERTKAAQERLQAKATNVKADREVKVQATRRGYIGNKIREEGDVFILQLGKGEPLPSWVEAVVDPKLPTTPVSHSSEAKEEVVDAAGIGHTTESLKKDLVQ